MSKFEEMILYVISPFLYLIGAIAGIIVGFISEIKTFITNK